MRDYKIIRLTWVCLSAALLSLLPVARGTTPEECVKAYYSAVAKQGVTATLDLIHPDDLKVFRGLAEQFSEKFNDSEMGTLLGVPTSADKVPVSEPLTDRQWAARAMPMLERMQDSILQLRKNAVLETVGSVADGDLRYVVIRWRIRMVGTEVVKLAVATTKMRGGEPMMMMPEELMQMARLLGAQFKPSGERPNPANDPPRSDKTKPVDVNKNP